jgi:hypothetical protein
MFTGFSELRILPTDDITVFTGIQDKIFPFKLGA